MQIPDTNNANPPVVIHDRLVPPSRNYVRNLSELVGSDIAAAVHAGVRFMLDVQSFFDDITNTDILCNVLRGLSLLSSRN